MTSNESTNIYGESEVMRFGSGNPSSLKVKDTPIQCKISCRFLGMQVDK